ncbi:hypothetical protein BSKO_06606 [Bryopsis sp. KO-2023]|nr:hypothetical protein BSKO_06606 [Bryopsis sp. KO-2023]
MQEAEKTTSGGRCVKGRFRLPASLLRLDNIFGSLSVVYSFLMKNHIQATWLVVRDALQGLCHDVTVSDDDIICMAEIASDIVAVREGVSCVSVAGPKDAWDINTVSSPKKQSSFIEAHKLRGILGKSEESEIRDGSGTVLEGDAKNLVIELFTPVRKATPVVTGSDEGIGGMSGKSGGRRGYRPRKKAFRDRLLMAVHQLHDEFLGQNPAAKTTEQRGASHLGSSDWHSQFDVDSVSVSDAIKAIRRVKSKEGAGTAARDLNNGPARPPRVLCQAVGCHSCADLNPAEFLDHIKQQDWYQNQIVHEESFPSRDPAYSDLQGGLSAPVRHAIESAGIQRLFRHQAEAIEGVLSGKDVVISTSTASGKSLCYNVPVLEALVRNPDACALYIFPTKALAQDQLRALRGFCTAAFGDSAPCVEVYDGDTGFEQRREIRNRAQLLITNPDMLHLSILPVHKDFSRLLSNLAMVVVDEGHAYKGVFGCHTAMVMRRLRRVCERQYGVVPRFMMTSATVANPREHMEALIGVKDVMVLSTDGSPHGAKSFALWNPPLRTEYQQEGATDGKLNKRAQQERSRHYQREANQVRGRGSQLSDVNGMTKAEWIQAVAVSKKRGIADEPPPPPCQSVGKRRKEGVQQEAMVTTEGQGSNASHVQAVLDSVHTSDHKRKRPLIIKGTRTAIDGRGASNDFEDRMPGPEWKGRTKSSGITDDKRRNSPMVEISLLLAECIQHGLRTIAFCMTRKLCELVMAYTREMLKTSAPHLADSLRVYRGGYSPEERREIEVGLFHGTLRAVAATNALELGIDVGDLDATLHLGFPGSAASLWQQSGRAGRREQTSLSIYVAFDGPLDQYFMKHPKHLFGRPIERVQVDASNVHILKDHVACAAKELPVTQVDGEYFGPLLDKTINELAKAGDVCRPPRCEPKCGIWKYSGSARNPASNVSLRAIDPERYAIVDEANGGKILEEIEESMAFFQVYEGAVYMFQGRTHLCTKMDLEKKIAFVRAADLKYYTTTRDFTDVHVIGGSVAYPMKNQAMEYPLTSSICANAQVTTRWLGFYRVWRGSEIAFDSVDLFLPDMQFETQAVYIRVPHKLRADVKQRGLEWCAGLHAANHALLNVIPLYLMCGSGDMKTECDNPYDTRYRPERVLIFDNHPGGIGLAMQALPLMSVLLGKAYELVKDCGCELQTGCPGCVQSTKCDEYNTVLCKEAALMILKGILVAEGCPVPRELDDS